MEEYGFLYFWYAFLFYDLYLGYTFRSHSVKSGGGYWRRLKIKLAKQKMLDTQNGNLTVELFILIPRK